MRIAPTLRDFIESHDWPQYGPHKQRMKELRALFRVARAAASYFAWVDADGVRTDTEVGRIRFAAMRSALAALDAASGGRGE